MPGQNLQKLTKAELAQLRAIVRKVYGENDGFTPQEAKQVYTDEECDKLIDSLLPETVEKLRELGVNSGFMEKKRFFLPSKILGLNGSPVMREDRG